MIFDETAGKAAKDERLAVAMTVAMAAAGAAAVSMAVPVFMTAVFLRLLTKIDDLRLYVCENAALAKTPRLTTKSNDLRPQTCENVAPVDKSQRSHASGLRKRRA